MKKIDLSIEQEFLNKCYRDCYTGDTKELLEFINSDKCSKNLIDYSGSDGKTALYVAVSMIRFNIVEALINKGANVNIVSNSLTPLMLALFSTSKEEIEENRKIINFLIDSGANFEPVNGLSPFSIACFIQKNETMKKMLNYNIDIDFIDKNGKTALDHLYEQNNTEGLKILKSYLLEKSIREELPILDNYQKRLKI